ncbi:MmgE/PrpD family protein [Aliiroseovarius sp.]|uniref:MmgE/PrpD family protein n=1 Tax=Aliiroseovarius sp. TaxID=1872442 RepID=UPI00262BF4FD|nr:MmgE/PrpD family protein [Aliiroseovarius sp.]
MSELMNQLVAFAHCRPKHAEDARRMMRLSLLDWAACGRAGAGEPVARITRDMVLTEGGQGAASLFGSEATVPPRAAALVNGASSHALDYDDTHFAHIGHPSVAVIPAALAVAQVEGASGEAFLDACLVGIEASIRIGTWLGRSHYQIGFHQTATAGAFGATVAAARLMGLDPDRTAQALGVASTRAAGLKSQFGTMGKPYHAGLAAQTGVEAVQLARAGFQSNPAGLDGAQGFGPTHAGEGNLSAFDGMNEDWWILSISHKFHACCHGTHAMLEALATLPPANSVDEVVVATHPRWLSVCNIPAPATGLEVKFSYAHVAAMALSGVPTGALQSFSDAVARDPALVTLAARVRVEADEAIRETAARVRVNGQEAEFDLDAPMALALRQEKLLTKARALLGTPADKLWQGIEAGPDLGALTR